MNAADLKAWRQRMGLTQAQVGDLFDVSRSHVCNMERGRKAVPGEFLIMAMIAEHGRCEHCGGTGIAKERRPGRSG